MFYIVIEHCFLYYLSEIYNLQYKFTIPAYLTFTLLFLEEVVAPDLMENIGGLADLREKGTDQWICIPLFTPLHKVTHMVYLVTQVTYRLH